MHRLAWLTLFLAVFVSSSAPAVPARMEGGGLQVTLDLDPGFYRNRSFSTGMWSGSNEIIGAFCRDPSERSRGQPIFLYVGVKHPRIGMSLPRLRSWVQRLSEAQSEKAPALADLRAPRGFTVEYWDPQGAFQNSTWNFYFESLVDGQWVELRFASQVGSPQEDMSGAKEIALRVIRSVRVRRLNGMDPGFRRGELGRSGLSLRRAR